MRVDATRKRDAARADRRRRSTRRDALESECAPNACATRRARREEGRDAGRINTADDGVRATARADAGRAVARRERREENVE